MLTSTEKMQEVVSLIVYIYIYVLIDLIFYLKAAGCNEEYVYLKDPITESVCC